MSTKDNVLKALSDKNQYLSVSQILYLMPLGNYIQFINSLQTSRPMTCVLGCTSIVRLRMSVLCSVSCRRMCPIVSCVRGQIPAMIKLQFSALRLTKTAVHIVCIRNKAQCGWNLIANGWSIFKPIISSCTISLIGTLRYSCKHVIQMCPISQTNSSKATLVIR